MSTDLVADFFCWQMFAGCGCDCWRILWKLCDCWRILWKLVKTCLYWVVQIIKDRKF